MAASPARSIPRRRSYRVRALRPSAGLPSVRHERLHAGASTREENMKLIFSKAAMWQVNNRRLDARVAEIRRDIGCCEQRKRKDYAQLDDVRKVQGQRRIIRPNL